MQTHPIEDTTARGSLGDRLARWRTLGERLRAAWSRNGLLIAIVLLATALRVAHLDGPSLFYDEVIALRLASQRGPAELLRLLGEIDATRAPLHPLLLQGWIRVFGASALAGRAFSVVCGVLAVVFVERLGRRAYGRPTGLWAAFLFAISPMQVRYAQELRMYALLVLETCIAWDLLFSFRASATRAKQGAFAAVLIALGYTHPLGLFMLAALALGYMCLGPGSQLRPKHWLAIQLAAALAIAPWMTHYVDHPPEITVGRLPVKFLIGLPIGYIGGNSRTLPGFLALILYGLASWSPSARPRFGLDRPAESLALINWFVVPPLLLYGHSLISPTPIFGPPRYTLFVGPAYLILVAHGLAKLPLLPRGAVAVVCVVLAGSLLRTLVYDSDEKPDWRDAARLIRRVDPAATVVYLTDEPRNFRQFVPLRHYLGPGARIMMMTAALERLAVDPRSIGPTAWTVSEIRRGRPRGHTPHAWLRRYEPVPLAWTPPGVELIYYRRKPPPGPRAVEPSRPEGSRAGAARDSGGDRRSSN